MGNMVVAGVQLPDLVISFPLTVFSTQDANKWILDKIQSGEIESTQDSFTITTSNIDHKTPVEIVYWMIDYVCDLHRMPAYLKFGIILHLAGMVVIDDEDLLERIQSKLVDGELKDALFLHMIGVCGEGVHTTPAWAKPIDQRFF